MTKSAYIYDVLRTPRGRGKKGGALHEIKPIDLLLGCMNALEKRNNLHIPLIDDFIVGCATPISEQGGNIAKAALLYAGWDDHIPGMQINRFCASSLDAVNLATTKILSGWENCAVVGGVESMSRVPMGNDRGALLFDSAVNAKVKYIPQGVSADLIATIEDLSRESLDEYALQSHTKAAFATEKGYFSTSVVPVYDMNGLVILDKDELVRTDSSLEALAQLPAAFTDLGALGFDTMALLKYPHLEYIQHHHTAGNSSGIVDGASLALIGNEDIGKQMEIKPRARIRMGAVSGSEPTAMLQGAIPAARKVLKLAGMQIEDIDLFEVNEAFAAPVLQFQRTMGINPNIINVNGGAIAMGHPLGATGVMLLGSLLDELERRDLQTGMVAMCVGGGMGIATIIERV